MRGEPRPSSSAPGSTSFNEEEGDVVAPGDGPGRAKSCAPNGASDAPPPPPPLLPPLLSGGRTNADPCEDGLFYSHSPSEAEEGCPACKVMSARLDQLSGSQRSQQKRLQETEDQFDR